MRERSTWQVKRPEVTRQAATSRRADIYEMNAEHPQPSPDQYMPANAGPDMWAETPANYDNSLVKADYDNKGHVKRNEVGFADFQAPTFDRPAWGSGKYDNHKFASSERKALASHRLASSLLRTNDREIVRKVAVGFMALPDAALNNALKAIQEVSPAAMNDQARFKRAYACTKLAARMLGEEAEEATVERLARSIFQIDDPTLKSMIKIVAASKTSESKSDGSKTAGPPAQAEGSEKSEGSAKKGPPAKAATEKKEEPVAAEGSWGSASESAEEGGHGMPVAEAEGSGSASEGSEGSGAPDLMAMMSAPAPAPAAPVPPMPAPAAPVVASDISFDDDSAEPMTVHTSALEALFSDDPEVKAQREIAAAQREQVTRAAGYKVERTASAKGAKKLGSVKAGKEAAPETLLTAIWERP